MKNNKKKFTELNNAIKRLGLTPKEAIAILTQAESGKDRNKSSTTIISEKEEIFKYVKMVLEEDLHYLNVNLNSKLIDDLYIDSLDMVELVITVEHNYEIEIEDKAIEKWETVKDIVNTVYQLINE